MNPEEENVKQLLPLFPSFQRELEKQKNFFFFLQQHSSNYTALEKSFVRALVCTVVVARFPNIELLVVLHCRRCRMRREK